MVTDTTIVNNRIECGGFRVCFHVFVFLSQSDLRQSWFWRKVVYQQCGGTYKGLCKQNVSGVVGWRYSVGGDD